MGVGNGVVASRFCHGCPQAVSISWLSCHIPATAAFFWLETLYNPFPKKWETWKHFVTYKKKIRKERKPGKHSQSIPPKKKQGENQESLHNLPPKRGKPRFFCDLSQKKREKPGNRRGALQRRGGTAPCSHATNSTANPVSVTVIACLHPSSCYDNDDDDNDE